MKRFERGDIWIVDLGYAAKVRPCLILTHPATQNDRALVTLVPHTTQPRGSQFEVLTATPPLRSGAFDVQNIVTASEAKLSHKIATCPVDVLELIEDKLKTIAGTLNETSRENVYATLHHPHRSRRSDGPRECRYRSNHSEAVPQTH